MEFNKRSRTTNREQFALMVERMKLNESIAKNMSKQSPEVVSVFWTTLSTDLNALGPPSKSISEWKKVWSDFKSSIKKKLSSNRIQMQATGGGPNAEVHLTALEEEVSQLVCLSDATEGVSGRSHGFHTPRGTTTESAASQPPHSSAIPRESRPTADIGEDVDQDISAARTSQPQQRVPQRCTQMRLLKTQVDLQKKFHDNVSASLRGQRRKIDDLASSTRKIEKTLCSLNGNVQNMCTSLQDLVVETKRHNLAIEQLMRDKTRLKQQLLHLELEKVNETLSK